VAVREERFQELVAAEVAYLATVPVKPVSMRQVLGWENTQLPHVDTCCFVRLA